MFQFGAKYIIRKVFTPLIPSTIPRLYLDLSSHLHRSLHILHPTNLDLDNLYLFERHHWVFKVVEINKINFLIAFPDGYPFKQHLSNYTNLFIREYLIRTRMNISNLLKHQILRKTYHFIVARKCFSNKKNFILSRFSIFYAITLCTILFLVY